MAESISTPAHLKNQEYIPSKICMQCGFIKPATLQYFYQEYRGDNVFKPTCKKCEKQAYLYRAFNKQQISGENDIETFFFKKKKFKMTFQESIKKYFEYRIDGYLIWNQSKGLSIKGNIIQTVGAGGYIYGKLNGKTFLAHRAIWIWHNGDIPKGFEIDHINGNRKDNRIENLRLVTRQQNQTNMTNAKGFSFNKKMKKWQVCMRVTYKLIHYGYYDTIIDARASYLKAKREVLHDYLQ